MDKFEQTVLPEDDELQETLNALKKDEQRKDVRESRKKGFRLELYSLFMYALIVFFVAMFVITFVGQRTRVRGDSMNDTLKNGDNLILEKLSYRFGDPQRFDIIVFRFLDGSTNQDSKVFYVKRIIGLPGETVQIIGDDIYINGELLEEDYGKEAMESAGIAAEPITLGEEEYFVLGDNRNHSSDSRDPLVGTISRNQILGKAWLRIWPLSSFGFVTHE